MGASNSLLSEEKLDEYVELTYLTKSEIVYILQKFVKIQKEKNIANDLEYRHEVSDIINRKLCSIILQKFVKIQKEKNIANDLEYRHEVSDIIKEFPQYEFNPFRYRIFEVFSSHQDERFSFEDFLDLSSVMSLNCPLKVKAAWAFKVFDFDDDNQITKDDLIDILEKLTFGSELLMDEKNQICDILLEEIALQHTGGMSQLEFCHAITKMPEFATTFSCRL